MKFKTEIIESDEYYYTASYFTTNKWIDNDTFVAVRSKNKTVGANEKPFTDVSEIVICNLETGAQEVVCDDLISFEDYLVFGKFIFYSNGLELKRINIENKAVDILCRAPEFERIQSEEKSWDLPLLRNPCITADGKYISMFAYNGRKNEFGRIIRFVEMFRYSINEGKLVKVFEKAFKEPFWDAGHVMISPTDCNKLFYCHEGNSHYITNRLWMYDIGKQTDKNIAKQDMDENGCLTECFGHEIWAPDGKGLYFVKYSDSPKKPTGLCYVSLDDPNAKILYSKYRYWHVSVSDNGRFLLSDTQSDNFISSVILIDMLTGDEKKIAETRTDWIHPCHPHPQMSPQLDKVIFTGMNDAGRTCIKLVRI